MHNRQVVLWVLHGFPDYLRSPLEFIPSLRRVSPPDFLGISLSTIVLVLIDMKCQQFIVQTKDVRNVYLGSVLAARLILEVTGYNHAPPPASGQQRKI